jgi:hypothetical protein
MPVFEYECDKCVEKYNSDISDLVKKLNKTSASKLLKRNPGFKYIESSNSKDNKVHFSIGERGKPNTRRFRYPLDRDKVLYLELKNYRFSELIYNKEEEKDLKCPLCKKGESVRRVFSTFKAIFDDKNKRAPRPGDELRWHLEYKQQKDEEIKSEWVGQDYLDQYFQR